MDFFFIKCVTSSFHVLSFALPFSTELQRQFDVNALWPFLKLFLPLSGELIVA